MSQVERGPTGEKAVKVPLIDMVSDDGSPPVNAAEEMPTETLYYWDYLHLDYLLNAQTPKSAERGGLVHDEYFFIVVHQTYELWFKQILVELDSVMAIMAQDRIPGLMTGTASAPSPVPGFYQQSKGLPALARMNFLDIKTDRKSVV